MYYWGGGKFNWGKSSNSAVKHRQAGSKLTDRAAMRCAAGERALFTSNAECGTARQQRREMDDGRWLGLMIDGEFFNMGTGWGGLGGGCISGGSAFGRGSE